MHRTTGPPARSPARLFTSSSAALMAHSSARVLEHRRLAATLTSLASPFLRVRRASHPFRGAVRAGADGPPGAPGRYLTALLGRGGIPELSPGPERFFSPRWDAAPAWPYASYDLAYFGFAFHFIAGSAATLPFFLLSGVKVRFRESLGCGRGHSWSPFNGWRCILGKKYVGCVNRLCLPVNTVKKSRYSLLRSIVRLSDYTSKFPKTEHYFVLT